MIGLEFMFVGGVIFVMASATRIARRLADDTRTAREDRAWETFKRRIDHAYDYGARRYGDLIRQREHTVIR